MSEATHGRAGTRASRWPRPTQPAAASGPRSGKSGYLPKWLLLGVTIGVIAGLGAVVFYLALKYTARIPARLSGGLPHSRARRRRRQPRVRRLRTRPWAIPLVTTGGALLSALIVTKFAPEATGHGTDEAIEAVHTDPRAIRFRAVLVKMVASALTIGSGGSAGREGPTAQISAGFSSLLTRRLHLSDEDGRIAVALGIGAGIGAIFAAPLGGAVLAASITYRDDFDYRCSAARVHHLRDGVRGARRFPGLRPVVRLHRRRVPLRKAWPLLWFVVIGLVAAAIGYIYARIFHAAVALTRRLPGGPVLKPAVGGLLVGLLGLLIPQILSSGYGWAQLAADREVTDGDPVVDHHRAAASPRSSPRRCRSAPADPVGCSVPESSSALSSGPPSGGWASWPGLPGVPDEPGIFVVVGMMACFGSVARAPLAIMIMVAEMTGSFSVVPGAILAVGIASMLMSRTNVTIYEAQRLDREAAEAERAGQNSG